MTARPFAVLATALCLLAMNAQFAFASYPADPWADAVYNSSGTNEVDNPQNALGPPDGQTVHTVGLQSFITLDMGEGEEGTGPLRVYFGQLLVQSNIQVTFLDSSLNPITSDTRSLTIAASSSQPIFPYDPSAFGGQAYRYVRLTSTAEAGFPLDAVEALSYNHNVPAPTTTTTPPSSVCQSDTWTCSDWSDCSSAGTETRSCVMTNDCPTVATPSPDTTRDCSQPPQQLSSQSSGQPTYVYVTNNNTSQPASQSQTQAPNPTSVSNPPTPPGSSAQSTSQSGSTRTSGSTPSSGSTGAGTGAGPTLGTTSPTSTHVFAPIISDLQATPVDPNTERITWTTDMPSDSLVEYGPENGPTQFSPLGSDLTTDHGMTLAGLTPATNYVFRVYSRDAAGTQSRSPESSFVTEAPNTASMQPMLASTTPGWCVPTSLALLVLTLLSAGTAVYWYGVAMNLKGQTKKK